MSLSENCKTAILGFRNTVAMQTDRAGKNKNMKQSATLLFVFPLRVGQPPKLGVVSHPVVSQRVRICVKVIVGRKKSSKNLPN